MENKLINCIRNFSEETIKNNKKLLSSELDVYKSCIEYHLITYSKLNARKSILLSKGEYMLSSSDTSSGKYFVPNEITLKQIIAWLEEEGFQVEREIGNLTISW